MEEKEKMFLGKMYNPYAIKDDKNPKDILSLINKTYDNIDISLLKPLFKRIEDDAIITPPLYFDHGYFISIGKHFYANTGLIILDEAEVIIGDNVLIGPRVSIYTPLHPFIPSIRNKDVEIAKSVIIKDNVWIAGDVIINPGVTIGENVIVGSGSVVTKDIKDNTLAFGNPCKAVREINDRDYEYWHNLYMEYRS